MANNSPEKYYLIIPLPHGNGGWSGARVVASGSIQELKKKFFADIFDDLSPEPDPFAMRTLNSPRICVSEDPNAAILVFNEKDWVWESV